MDIVMWIIIGCVTGSLLVFFVMRRVQQGISHNSMEKFMRDSEQRFTHAFQEMVSRAQEQMLLLAGERFGAHHQSIQKELDGKKEVIQGLIEEIRRDIHSSKEHIKQADERSLASFSALKQELEMQKGLMGELRMTTEDLKNVLSNNQLRGSFGEEVAENILKMAGFVVGSDYIVNTEQESVETRPDFTIFLPDKTRVNIDVKFPYASLVSMSAAEEEIERDRHFRQFVSDVKQKIKQMTSRDYINPEEKTVDFVILFIPNEMIFSFIYERMHEVWEHAMRQKVILAGPFSFTALLRMIRQAHANFRYQENIHHIIGLIGKFENEFEKFSESIDVLGSRLETAVKQYQTVSGTRTRSLSRIIDQIKNQNGEVLQAGEVAQGHRGEEGEK